MCDERDGRLRVGVRVACWCVYPCVCVCIHRVTGWLYSSASYLTFAVRVCVSVCERDRERERDGEREERERERERERQTDRQTDRERT